VGIKPKKRGRKKGNEKKLHPEQEKEIKAVIIDKYPEQLKLPGCMWTRANIRDLIKRKYDIVTPLSTLGNYLKSWCLC
jgi:transposase